MIVVKRTLTTLSLVVALGIGVGIGVYVGTRGFGTSAPAAAESAPTPDGSSEDALPETRTNADGLTYGVLRPEPTEAYLNGEAVSDLDVPDLILVVGDKGREGYVYRSAILPDPESLPTSPEEAVAYTQAQARAAKTFPVYTSDGVTQIDTYTVD